MSMSSAAKKAVEWYSKNRALYQALAKKVESIIREILDSEKINYHSVTSRAKTIESYEQKASKKVCKEPLSDIKDMAGIRVITFTDSDAKKATGLIQDAFDILPSAVIDKAKELGVNKVGYRSIHCIGTLGKKRLQLPENRIFEELRFEIQVRTILQHAWAEFAHDRNYKFRGVLPDDLKRRLMTISGNLELIDKEFDDISRAIDDYSAEVKHRTETGDLDIPINTTSLVEYMRRRFQPLVELGVKEDLGGEDERAVFYLLRHGIGTLRKLEDIIPKDYVEKRSRYIHSRLTFASILRDLMAISDVDELLEFERKHYLGIILHKMDLLFFEEMYGIDLRESFKKHDLDLVLTDK